MQRKWAFVKALLLILLFVSGHLYGQRSLKSIDSIAVSMEMEFVHGDKFPLVNPFGSYGSSAIFDFLVFEAKGSALYLFRKLKVDLKKISNEQSTDLVLNYDYFLVSAIRGPDKNWNYSVLPIEVGLHGMSLYYMSLDMDLSKFRFIDGKKESGPRGIDAYWSNGCVPIVISTRQATTVLYYYKGRWLSFVDSYH